MNLVWALIVMGCLLTSCYRMPAEDEYSLIPTTNNPVVTREKPCNPFPNMGR